MMQFAQLILVRRATCAAERALLVCRFRKCPICQVSKAAICADLLHTVAGDMSHLRSIERGQMRLMLEEVDVGGVLDQVKLHAGC